MRPIFPARASARQLRLALLCAGFILFAPAAIQAHEGHDHAAAPADPSGLSAAPRFVATSEDFELVGVLAADHLTLYLDDAPTNRPIDGATLEVELGGVKTTALRADIGTYRLPLRAQPGPGRHALTVSIDALAGSDLLSGTLEVAASGAPAAVSVTSQGIRPVGWLAAGAAVLLAAAASFFFARRRAKAAGAKGA